MDGDSVQMQGSAKNCKCCRWGRRNAPDLPLSDRVFFQFTHKLAYPFDTRFPLTQILNKFQARRTIKAVMLRLFLQQTNQQAGLT